MSLHKQINEFLKTLDSYEKTLEHQIKFKNTRSRRKTLGVAPLLLYKPDKQPEQGCQIFFIAYGQNPDKNGQNGCFLKKVMAKITKSFNYGNFHIHRCLKLFGSQYIFCQKTWFCQRSKFYPKTAIFAVNIK